MNLEHTPLPEPFREVEKLPSAQVQSRFREIMLQHPQDSGDLWRLFAKTSSDSSFDMTEPLGRLLSADGITHTRPLERVSLQFLIDYADQCALFAETWGPVWGQWMNQYGDHALEEWEKQVPLLLSHVTKETLRDHHEILFVDHRWLTSYSSELLQVQQLFSNRSRSLFLKMKDAGISPQTSGLRSAIDDWGLAAYGLIEKSQANVIRGFSVDQKKAIQRIVDLVIQYDQERLLPEVFLNLQPPHFEERTTVLLEAVETEPAKVVAILQHFPICEGRNVIHAGLEILRHAGPSVKESLCRLGTQPDCPSDEITQLIQHSGVYSYLALQHRLSSIAGIQREKWLPELHRYGHAFWSLMAKFKGELLEGISEHREFIERIFPLCTGGTGKFLQALPVSLWNSDGVRLAERFRESAGDVWNALHDDASSWLEGSTHSDLSNVLLDSGRIRGIHRYLSLGKKGDARFDSLKLLADRLQDGRRYTNGKKTCLFIIAGTDPLNSFGKPSTGRILHDLLDRFDLTVHEARSKSEVSDSLEAVSVRDEGQQLPLLVVAAHGNSFGMQFGGLRHALPCPADGTQISLENYVSIHDRQLVASWGKYFGPESDIVSLSCSNFSEATEAGGLGAMLSQELAPARVIGMRWNMTPIKINFDESTRVTDLSAR